MVDLRKSWEAWMPNWNLFLVCKSFTRDLGIHTVLGFSFLCYPLERIASTRDLGTQIVFDIYLCSMGHFNLLDSFFLLINMSIKLDMLILWCMWILGLVILCLASNFLPKVLGLMNELNDMEAFWMGGRFSKMCAFF